jgi:hypothetical protein
MSDEVLRVENFFDANRKRFHIEQIYSWYSEQGFAGTRVTFADDAGAIKPLVDAISKELPKSARATIGAGDQGGPGEAGRARRRRCTWSATRPRHCRNSAVTSFPSCPSARNCVMSASTSAIPTAN